jgi:Phosphotransferase enzyme family
MNEAAMGLDTCLDPVAMRELLQAWLPGGEAISQVHIGKVRRSASRHRHPNPLTLVYETELHSGGSRRYYAKVYRHGASLQALQGSAALPVPPLDMLLWTWPADPALPQLPELLDGGRALAWLDGPGTELPAEVELLGYEPEQRATLRYTRGERVVYAKTFCDDRGARIHERFEHFWSLAQHDEDAPRVAQPLGWQARTRSVWQGQAPGEPLVQVLGSVLPRRLPVRLARAMAVLHAQSLPTDAVHDPAHWLREVRRRAQKISRAVPALGGRVAALADAIERAAFALPLPVSGLIHGDFHAGQVGVQRDDAQRIVFHDFDEFALGDPMEDLAAFVTRLPLDRAPAEVGALVIAAYAQEAPERFGRRRLQWHLAVQMLLQASRAFVFQIDGWRDELERRLARAEALCAPGFQETQS